MCRAIKECVREVKKTLKNSILLTGVLIFLGASASVFAMTDTDGDAVPDEIEVAEGTDPNNPADFLDSDGDGSPDYSDQDSDGDSVPDLLEYGGDPYLDGDMDGVPVYLDDADTDAAIGNADGKVEITFDPDNNQTAAFQDPAHDHEIDSDGDTVPDSIEIAEGTDPSDSSSFIDTDADGLSDFTDGEADNDGLEDLLEAGVFPYYDRDCDGVPAYLDDDDYDWTVGDVDNRVQILFDPDNDGVASFQDASVNNTDTDGDNDQVPDAVEVFEGTDPADGTSFRDSDADGIPNFIDPDDDNDTIPDHIEGDADADQDKLPNYLDLDSDSDGVSDEIEGSGDANGNFIPDFLDTEVSTPVTNTDSDSDGISDAVEGQGDADNDGTPNFQDTDSDADGIADIVEGTADLDSDQQPNYLDIDSDGDSIPDQTEGVTDFDADGNANYLDTDSDADGIPDATETATDTDNDGAGNYTDLDSDADGISDAVELTGDPDADNLPNFLDDDSDGDGVPDSVELLVDTDGDNLPAYLDSDESTAAPNSLTMVQTGLDGGCVLGNGRGAIDPALLLLLVAGFIGLSRRRNPG